VPLDTFFQTDIKNFRPAGLFFIHVRDSRISTFFIGRTV
jgi:hypothetical protein